MTLEDNDLHRFLAAIDAELTRHAGPGETAPLYLLGRSALVLEDVQILCDNGLLDAATLRERLDSARLFRVEEDEAYIRSHASLEMVIDYLEGRRSNL
jgi:hypothetical protein